VGHTDERKVFQDRHEAATPVVTTPAKPARLRQADQGAQQCKLSEMAQWPSHDLNISKRLHSMLGDKVDRDDGTSERTTALELCFTEIHVGGSIHTCKCERLMLGLLAQLGQKSEDGYTQLELCRL